MPPPWMKRTALPGRSPRRWPIPGGVQRCAVACGQEELLGVDTLDGCSGGGDVVHHAVTADPPGLDVADRSGLRLSQRFQQGSELCVHLRVKREGHGPTVSWPPP